MTWIEALGSLAGIISVWLTMRVNIWAWAWGIASVLLYTGVFFRERLYADMALQLVFCAMNAYGWFQWLYGGEKRAERIITRLPAWMIAPSVLATALCAALFAFLLGRFTNAALPEMDAFLTSMSLCAVWMQARKYCENWLVWLVADVLYVGMFFYKSLWLTCGLYVVFTVLAFLGYRQWVEVMKSSPISQQESTFDTISGY